MAADLQRGLRAKMEQKKPSLHALHIRRVSAVSGSTFVAQAAGEAVKPWPDERLAPRHGILRMQEPNPPHKC